MKSSDQANIAQNDICAHYDNNPAALIEILHDVQDREGFIPESTLASIALALNITRAEVHGVVSFYEDFKTSLPAKITIKICRGEACQSLGANALMDRAKDLNENVAVEAVYCLGNCALAPAIMIDNKLHGRVDAKHLTDLIGKDDR